MAWVAGSQPGTREVPESGSVVEKTTKHSPEFSHVPQVRPPPSALHQLTASRGPLSASPHRRYTREENIKTQSKVKSSEQRQIRSQIVEQYPALEPFIEDILPKKEALIVCKCKDYLSLVVDTTGEFIFFQCRSGPYIPTIRFLHRFPDILPTYMVDRGAIRFVLSGANIMAPGLTSAGGHMDDVPANSVVAVMAEGKEHALAIGITTMGTKQILDENKGIAVENTHWLKDGLWTLRRVEV